MPKHKLTLSTDKKIITQANSLNRKDINLFVSDKIGGDEVADNPILDLWASI